MRWTNLPESLFGDVVSGAVLLHPRDPANGSSQNITACTLAAGWGTSSLTTDTFGSGGCWSSPIDLSASEAQEGRQGNAEPIGPGIEWHTPIFTNSSGSLYPQKPISMDPVWLTYLNPLIDSVNGTSTTAINAYMSLLPEQTKDFAIARVINYMLIGALPFVGFDTPWQGT